MLRPRTVGMIRLLVDNPDYADIAEDYRATFAEARAMPVDVFVASHGSF